MGKIRFLSSLVVEGSFAAILRPPPPATPLTSDFFLAVKVTVVMQHVAGDVHPAVEEQVAAGESDVPPAVLQAGDDRGFVGPP